jgi:zinc/manganese transport system substrate-binding protein
MKSRIILFICLALAPSAFSKPIRVAAAYPYIADLVRRIGSDRVEVNTMASGSWDPHTVIPKPSLIARLRQADLLVINGGQLEIGWMPPLVNQANNPGIQTGTRGLLDLSRSVKMIEVPSSVSRAQGDVHPQGNPHFVLDPENLPLLAAAITERLSEIDPPSAGVYEKNLGRWRESWNRKLDEWKNRMKPLEGSRVVEYHKIFDYFLNRYGLVLVGTVEPLPGITPTSHHLEVLGQVLGAGPVRFILQDVYNPDNASRHLSKKYGIPEIVLPHDVGAVPGTETLEAMFDAIVGRLTHE